MLRGSEAPAHVHHTNYTPNYTPKHAHTHTTHTCAHTHTTHTCAHTHTTHTCAHTHTTHTHHTHYTHVRTHTPHTYQSHCSTPLWLLGASPAAQPLPIQSCWAFPSWTGRDSLLCGTRPAQSTSVKNNPIGTPLNPIKRTLPLVQLLPLILHGARIPLHQNLPPTSESTE